MIRIIFILFSLAALFFLFYIGSFTYYQPREGHIAIVYDREDGYSLAEGLKIWDIKRMLPFGSQIIYISNSFYTSSFDMLGKLGSVQLFTSTLADTHENFFSYHLEGKIGFRLTSEALIDALNSGNTESKKITLFYSHQAQLINSEIAKVMEGLFLTNSTLTEQGERAALEAAITERLYQKFHTMEWQPITFTTISLPNLTLYQEMLNASLAKIQAIAEAEHQVQYRVAIESATQEQRLKLLEEYGKLLTQYPILIQFFAVDSGKFLPREALEAFMPPAAAGS